MRQDARATEKRRLREAGKQRKRARLDPDAAQATALDLQRQQAAPPAAKPGAAPRLQLGGAAPSVDELRQRLHRRIEVHKRTVHLPTLLQQKQLCSSLFAAARQAMRQGRHADEPAGSDAAAAPGGKAAQVQAAREWRRQAVNKRCGASGSAGPALRRQVALLTSDRAPTQEDARGRSADAARHGSQSACS